MGSCHLVIVAIFLGCTSWIAEAQQVRWLPSEASLSTGYWLAETGPVQDAVERPSWGAQAAWTTKTSTGWAAHFSGIEHGGFMGLHHTGSSDYGIQGQAGWLLRTRQLRMIGWSYAGGVVYNSRIYNAETAPNRIAVGSHLNGLIRLGITVANGSPVGLDLGILHTSNGALRRPNQGINTVHASLVIRPGGLPIRGVVAEGATRGSWRSMVGLALGGRDHGPYGGTILGVQELLAQTTYALFSTHGLTAQVSLVHHGALGADPNTGEPSDTIGTAFQERIQPSISGGWTWLFGRARLDLLTGGVLLHPTPGFLPTFAKAQCMMRVSRDLDVFASLRFTDWRADYVSAGIALRWGDAEAYCHTCPSYR